MNRWKTAATQAPTPSAITMYPSWLIVEYARTFLMSCWTKASTAPIRIVIPPMSAIMFTPPSPIEKPS